MIFLGEVAPFIVQGNGYDFLVIFAILLYFLSYISSPYERRIKQWKMREEGNIVYPDMRDYGKPLAGASRFQSTLSALRSCNILHLTMLTTRL